MPILLFAMVGEFFQQAPILGNQYEEDPLLTHYLEFRLPHEVLQKIRPSLVDLGEASGGYLLELARKAEKEPPLHTPYGPWGRREDSISLSSSWQALEQVAVQRGIVATAYERKEEEYSRLHQFALLYLFHPSSAFVTCPLAMSDGAARLLELYGGEEFRPIFSRLCSRDLKNYWLSGQWMTERSGGSDIQGTETKAILEKDNQYELYGTKWFCSAVHAPMSLALARVEEEGKLSSSLSVFFVELRDTVGALRNISIYRLKDKLGTRALPTAELRLEGTPAKLLGEKGKGVKTISTMFNISRMYNSVCAVASMRRALAYVKNYAGKRKAFQKELRELPLYEKVLLDTELEFHLCFHLTFHMSYLLGKEELGKTSSQEKSLLRLLTPLVKLYTGKKAPSFVSEAMELVGGVAYMEDTDFPGLYRDSQVFPIWEGTTNILSLDMYRAMRNDPDCFSHFCMDIELRLKDLSSANFQKEIEYFKKALEELRTKLESAHRSGEVEKEIRSIAFSMGDIYAYSLLLEFGHWCGKNNCYPKVLDIIKAGVRIFQLSALR